MSRKHYALRALHPKTGDLRQLRLPQEVALNVLKYGPPAKFYELRGDDNAAETGSSVREVLTKPSAVFGGVREHEHGGLCYCGRPRQRWTNAEVKCPPPPGMVFLVFVSPADGVYEWRWEWASESNAEFPAGFDRRFEGLLWPRS